MNCKTCGYRFSATEVAAKQAQGQKAKCARCGSALPTMPQPAPVAPEVPVAPVAVHVEHETEFGERAEPEDAKATAEVHE